MSACMCMSGVFVSWISRTCPTVLPSAVSWLKRVVSGKETCMLTRILVPLDGSTRAENVLLLAVYLTQSAQGLLVLLQVIESSDVTNMTGLSPTSYPFEARKIVQHHLQAKCFAYRKQITGMPICAHAPLDFFLYHRLHKKCYFPSRKAGSSTATN
ncbi:universal stress protein [Ktedonobacter sp. SOSP1-52]|uniref:universal stress protein n=1 Tax=Ktedonobacter sp. SOSP1-52 TaxID=2778366 RepID=UPI0035B184B7